MKNILILHGWESNNQEHWFQAAKKELEKIGYIIHAPNLPNTKYPKRADWIAAIKKFNPDKNWILVGHSLGGTAILRYLETAKKPVAKSVFISTPIENLGVNFSPIKNFLTKPFRWSRIKKNTARSIVLSSRDDQYVSVKHAEEAAKKLDSKLYIKNGYDHGFDNAPLKLILDIIREEE